MKKDGLKMITIISIVTLILIGCSRNSETQTTAKQDLPVVKVGCDIYPPFNYTNADGQPTGIDIDLAKEAFHRMGYEPEFLNIDWEMKKELLEEGTIDCIWSSFTMDGREEEYQWAGPYMISRQVIAVLKESDIYTLQDLEGKSVAVQATTKPEEIFLSHKDDRIPNLKQIFSMQDRELIYPMLSKGYVDAVAAHETSILQYMSDYDLEYRILEEPLQVVGLGVAFSIEDDRGLDQQLSEVFKEMRTDGTEQEIISHYLENADQYLEVDENE